MPLRLGTRASPLARWQAEWVAAQLRSRGIEVALIPIVTAGDRQRGVIGETNEPGLFTKEIQLALLDGRIDLAVHSLKDLPTEPVAGLTVAAVPERGPFGDALVSTDATPLNALPQGARVGTGSLRRRAQLLHVRPDLTVADIRGNVDTRLRKLREGGYDALLLAEAGLRRLALDREIAELIPPEIVLPAPGQGALSLEIRADDVAARACVTPLDHSPTHNAVRAERALSAALDSGCLAPVAALGRVEGDRLTLVGRVLSPDGAKMIESRLEGPACDAESLGRRVAGALLAQGAAAMIHAARTTA
ncbi:MAG: hydroxymethylbilane synthase [Thermoguttaceae bacterium]